MLASKSNKPLFLPQHPSHGLIIALKLAMRIPERLKHSVAGADPVAELKHTVTFLHINYS